VKQTEDFVSHAHADAFVMYQSATLVPDYVLKICPKISSAS
jgi:hypothetical protein